MPEHIFNCMQYAHAVAQCYNVTGCICNVTMLQCYRLHMLHNGGASDEQTFVRVAHFSYFSAHSISEKTIWRDSEGLVPWVAACLCRYLPMLAYTCLYLPMPILVDLAQWEQVTDTTRRLPPQAIRLKENHLSTYRMHNCTPLEKKQFSTQATWKHNIWGHTTWAQRFVKDDLWPVKNALLVLSDCCTST